MDRIEENFVRVFEFKGRPFAVSQYLFKQDPLSLPPNYEVFEEGKLKKIGPLKGLKGDIVLGMASFDADGDGKPDFIVNEDGRVVVKSFAGDIITDLPRSYGNTGVAFFYKEPMTKVFYENEGFLEMSKEDYARFKELTLTVPGRVAVYDKGKYPLVAVFRNKPFVWGAYFDPFRSSEVKIYRWRKGYFEDVGWNRMLPEGIRDVALYDVNGDGRPEVLLLTSRGVKTRREGLKFYSRLIIYRGPR